MINFKKAISAFLIGAMCLTATGSSSQAYGNQQRVIDDIVDLVNDECKGPSSLGENQFDKCKKGSHRLQYHAKFTVDELGCDNIQEAYAIIRKRYKDYHDLNVSINNSNSLLCPGVAGFPFTSHVDVFVYFL